MSRFGVVSLLLVLFLDFGHSLAHGCTHVYDKLKVHEDESSFRDNSQPVFRNLLRPFATAPARASEEGALFRKAYLNKDGFVKGEVGEAEEQGFRSLLGQFLLGSDLRFSHRAAPKKVGGSKLQTAQSKNTGGKKRGKEESKESPSMVHNILEKLVSSPSFCKYVQNFLRRVIDFIG